VLEGEADQVPDQEPGNIVFNLVEVEHSVFRRAGTDLSADIEVTLAEALCGFSRVVLKHLDGRGLHINHRQPKGRILKPGQLIKITGEGMPYKKSDLRGNLYLSVRVKFPEDGWLQDGDKASKLQKLLPGPAVPIVAETIDEVDYDEIATLEDFGKDEQNGEAWEDDEDEGDVDGVPQCTQQ
jgi:DnaJ homolog subfamily A member 2